MKSNLYVLFCALFVCPYVSMAQTSINLVGDGVELEARGENGAILSIVDGTTGSSLRTATELAESFRLTLQKPDKSTATILGKDQHLSSVNVEGNVLTLLWNGPLKDAAGNEYPVAVKMTATTEKSGIVFNFHLENRSSTTVLEASYPYVGGLSSFGDGDAMIWAPISTPMERAAVPTNGGAAFAYPSQLIMSFLCVQSKRANRTVYFASQDPIARFKTIRFSETGIAGHTDLALSVNHQPFVKPGADWDGSPAVLRFTEGDWKSAAQLYRNWFQSAFGITKPKDDWIRRQSFFVMTMFMLPEGTINYTFKDIPRWAKAAKDHGINSVQISGWQRGGHDNGYPYYEPDPRIGTWDDLEQGIRYCHKLGMRVYFFANYQPMMVDSDWYKNDLIKYREVAENGGLTWLAGWGMGTLWARAGHPKLMTWANLAYPEYRKIIVDYFVKLASIGADGVHVDKMYPSAINYDPNSPLTPDTATWEGAMQLSREVMQACRKVNPNWCMSFECNWDRMLQFGGATWWVGNQLIMRKVFPENVETLGLYQAYDYLGVNSAVREGHAVMVAPLNFCRSIDWPPFRGLANYIKDVKKIRDELQETVFWGEVMGRTQLLFQGSLPDGVEYNTFRNISTSRRVSILTNSRMESRSLTIAGFEDSRAKRIRVYAPGKKPTIAALPAKLLVPAERILFLEEMEGDK